MSTIAEKLTTIAENEQKVYDKGHTDGYAEWENGLIQSKVYAYFFSVNDKKTLRKKWKPEYTSNAVDFRGMFDKGLMALKTVPLLDTSNGKQFNNMFSNCQRLETIPKLNITNAISTTGMFTSCNFLKNIEFEGIIQNDLSFSSSPLTVSSMKNIIQHMINLYDEGLEGSYTITFKNTCWDALEASGKPSQEEWTNVTDETMTWKVYVTSVLGWSV